MEIIESETRHYYSQEAQIESSLLKEIEKKGEISIHNGENIKVDKKRFSLFRDNNVLLGKFVHEERIEIRQANGELAISLISKEEIYKRISKIRDDKKQKSMSYIHIGTVQIILKSTYGNIDSPITLVILDNRIRSNNIKEKIIGRVKGNLKYSVVKFNVNVQYGIPLITSSLNESIGILYKFSRQDLMEKGDYPFSVTFAVSYAITNSHHSIQFLAKNKIEIEKLFEETSTKLETYEPVHPMIERSLSTRNFDKRMIKPRFIEQKDIFKEYIEKDEGISEIEDIPLVNQPSTSMLIQQLNTINKNIAKIDNKI